MQDRSRVAAAACAVVFLTSHTTAIDTTPTWETPQFVVNVPDYFLEFAAYEGQNRYLAFDHFGNPGIAYRSELELHLARPIAGLGWATEMLPDPQGHTSVNQPALAFGLDELPRVAYTGNAGGFYDRIVATFDGVSWQFNSIQLIGVVADEVLTSSLVVDILDRTATTFYRDSSSSIVFHFDADGDEDLFDDPFCTIDSAFGTAESSLALDSLNQAMIATAENTTLSFSARPTGHECFNTTVLTFAGRSPSLAIDPDTDFPAIAYFETGTLDLVYAEWDGAQWVFTNVDTGGSTGHHPSLAFDPADGNPAIAYQDVSNGDLRFAWHDGIQWNTQTVVDSNPKVPFGWTPSLAFNDFGTGFPSIAYFGIDQNLYYVADPAKVGDLDGDGFVGIVDFLMLLNDWGQNKSPADLDQDGYVGINDMLILLANWG